MKKGIKYALLIFIILAAVAGGVYYANMPLSVALTEIKPQTAELSFTEQGVIVAENTVWVYPSVQGEITTILAEKGQTVQAGDALCAIDATPLKLRVEQILNAIRGYEAQIANLSTEQNRAWRDLQTSRSSLEGELAALNAQEAESSENEQTQSENTAERLRLQQVIIEQNESEAERAKKDFAMAQALFDGGITTRNDFETAEANLNRAETALEISRQEYLVIAGGQHNLSNADYFQGVRESLNARISGIDRQLAEDNTAAMTAYYYALIDAERITIEQLNREIHLSEIRAPVSGIITELHAQKSNMAAPSSPLAEITIPGSNIEVFVSTQYVNSISAGDGVVLTLKQHDNDFVFNGVVMDIEKTAEIKYSSLGVEERKVKVLVAPEPSAEETYIDVNGGIGFKEMEPMLGIGYAVDVRFLLYQEENKFTVPKTALFKDNGADMVWVLRGDSTGTAEAVPVQTGMELRTETVIQSGLNRGDFVVSDANNKDLKNGIKITK